jgi:aryl-alcohol dehydrogenase-like predicted oxidoreductase
VFNVYQYISRCPVEKSGTSWVLRGDAESLRRDVDFALEQLGTDYIDIIVLCRVPKDVPIEESVAGMGQLVAEGKARAIGLSEAAPSIIRRAAAVHPIYCIEQEWSLWSRDIEDSIVPTCRELGIKIVAYSPLGRGFLTGAIRDRTELKDYRATNPKFAEGNFENNLSLVDAIQALADRKGITVGQLALAWLHAQGPDVIPIPGTSSIHHFDQNYAALQVTLTEEDLLEIDGIFHRDAAKGERYAGNHLTFHENDEKK